MANQISVFMDLVLLIELVALSITPFVELRGAIPIALFLGVDPVYAFLICTIANILMVPVLFSALDRFYPHLSRSGLFMKALLRIERSSEAPMKRYGAFGLALFIAIPFPGSVAYVGTLVAYMLKIDRVKAFTAIGIGITIAGVLTTYLSLKASGMLAW
jgi:uncharacterized membrane protein